jgi:arabinan endo-1,5-alpha-L-arabinosidase
MISGAFRQFILCIILSTCYAQQPLQGHLKAHDPSTIAKCGNRYTIYSTGNGIVWTYSTDLTNWIYGGKVFPPGKIPAWTSNAVPLYKDHLWAPDIVPMATNTYYLYYSVSSWGSQVSAIGLAVNTTLDPSVPGYQWIDQGPVIQSHKGMPYNCIDPSILKSSDGTLWMAFGSYWKGIYLIQLDPATGKRITPASPVTHLASQPQAIEAASLIQRKKYFYLFVNWGFGCKGLDSTYEIRIGRSSSVTGPYLDRNGIDLAKGGGSLFLKTEGRFIGPGHAARFIENGTEWFTYHYYDRDEKGVAKLALAQLQWSSDDWPEFRHTDSHK